MQILDTPEAMRSLSESWRREGRLIGFVPTMGALHEGHLSLVRRAREECDRLFASIFVNPLQFEARDDLERYERPFDRDSRLLRETGCDALFAPSVEAMYGAPTSGEGRLVQTFVEVKELGEILEGAVRPGHFRGVATIVAKLFNIGVPHRAYFGEKDYQQLRVIEQMVRDLFFDVEIVPGPTVREEDGAALVEGGERDAARLVEAMRAVCETQPLADVQYVAVVDARTLEPLTELVGGRPARALIAASIGGIHLIDNIAL